VLPRPETRLVDRAVGRERGDGRERRGDLLGVPARGVLERAGDADGEHAVGRVGGLLLGPGGERVERGEVTARARHERRRPPHEHARGHVLEL
jgi:hypothetical protein